MYTHTPYISIHCHQVTPYQPFTMICSWGACQEAIKRCDLHTGSWPILAQVCRMDSSYARQYSRQYAVVFGATVPHSYISHQYIANTHAQFPRFVCRHIALLIFQ